MGMYINETNFDIRPRVIYCTYTNSSTDEFGGGLYIFTSGSGSHSLSVENSSFVSNRAMRSGGSGLVLFTGAGSTLSKPHTFNVTGCLFENNRAGIGGALFFYSEVRNAHSVAHIAGCTFIRNMLTDQQNGFGAAFTIVNSAAYVNKELLSTHTMTDW